MSDVTLKWKQEVDSLFETQEEVGVNVDIYGVNNLQGSQLKTHSKTVKWYSESFMNTGLQVIDTVMVAVQNQYFLISDVIREHYGDGVHDASIASVYTVTNEKIPNLISVYDKSIYGKWAIRRGDLAIERSAPELEEFIKSLSTKLNDIVEIGYVVLELVIYQLHQVLPYIKSNGLTVTGGVKSDVEKIARGIYVYLSQLFLQQQIKQ